MQDFKGSELNVGDKVIFVDGNVLREGIISKFTPKQCQVTYNLSGKSTWTNRVQYPNLQCMKLA